MHASVQLDADLSMTEQYTQQSLFLVASSFYCTIQQHGCGGLLLECSFGFIPIRLYNLEIYQFDCYAFILSAPLNNLPSVIVVNFFTAVTGN
eukprot:scaffold43826_cov81-Cyclotella_meneghiniana.AAC.2